MLKRFFPVLHIENDTQALKNAEIVANSNFDGTKGLFLIHHRKTYKHLQKTLFLIKDEFPTLFIGINALIFILIKFFDVFNDVDAIWCDDSGIPDNYSIYQNAHLLNKAEFFGGVAFKYQSIVSNLEEAVTIANNIMDVVTTSGDGTGRHADVNKIKTMKSFCLKRLGIASGITNENINTYLPDVDDFLVSTGINDDFYKFNSEKLNLMANTIFNYQ